MKVDCNDKVSLEVTQFSYDSPTIIPRGWECPRCGRINAPFITTCICKPKDKQISELESTSSWI